MKILIWGMIKDFKRRVMSIAKVKIAGFAAVFVLNILLFGGCANQSGRPSDNSAMHDPYIVHTVSQPGETFGVIAAWYTKRSTNWQAIARANPSVNPNKIRIGQTIRIPRELVVEQSPLPASFVRRGVAVPTKKDVATTTTPESGESSPSAVKEQGVPVVAPGVTDTVAPTDGTVGSAENAPAAQAEAPADTAAAPDVAPSTEAQNPTPDAGAEPAKKVGDLQPEDSAGTPGEQPNGDAEREKLLNELLNE